MKQMLKLPEVASRLGLPLKRVRAMSLDGRLPSYRFGRCVRVDPDDLAKIDPDALDYATAENRAARDRPGWVYFIQCEVTDRIKIGVSFRSLERRIAGLRSVSPTPLRLLGTVSTLDYPEAVLHRRFAAHRLHGEWFEPSVELAEFIQQEARP